MSIEAPEETSSLGAESKCCLSQSEYGRLRDQCQGAMMELETLRRRNAEILSRCEKAVEEAAYYRLQHQRSLNKIDELSGDQKSLQAKYDQVVCDRNKLLQDYEEIVLLREQEKLETSKLRQQPIETKESSPGGSEALSDLQQENEELKYNFDDLQADHDLLNSKFKQLQEENMKLKEHHNVISMEYDSVIDERNALKQRMSAAIRGYEKALRDRDDEVQEAQLAKQQCAKIQREQEQQNKVTIQMRNDIMKLREERNSAMQEYKLVMSERDTVHQEIEKLQDDLGQTKDKAKKLNEDKEKVVHEKEGLRLEIMAVLADRDEALKEVHDLRSRLQIALKEKETSAKQLEEQRQDFEMLKQERNAAKKERGEAIVHRDKILKECFEVKRLFASMESGESDQTEGLKKQFDKLSHELTNAWNIAEVAITRRDWSFSERDKVLRESEVMKEKYSKVLKEKATLEEQVKLLSTSHDESEQKYKELRKLLPLTIANKQNLLSSQDSAIDSDTPPYHIETVELERACKDDDFGFHIGGGNDAPISTYNTSIFVIDVLPISIAANKLKVNDCIIRVNNIDMTNIESAAAYEAIFGTNYLNITILRSSKVGLDKVGFKSPLQRIEIKSNEDKSIGLSIDSGLHIKRIDPGSAAAEDETLSIGDKILTVNGQSTDNMTYKDAKMLLKRSSLNLTVLKPSMSSTSSQPSLPQHIDDEKVNLNTGEKIFDDLPKLFTVGSVSQLIPPSNPHHIRNSSAPVQAGSPTHDLTMHNRSISGIEQMSDTELKRISADLFTEVQRRKEEEAKTKAIELTEELISKRNSSFIVAVKTDQINTSIPVQASYPLDINRPLCRPMSAHSSKQSVSSGSTGRYSHDNRYSPSSPKILPTQSKDPLCLDPKNIGQFTGNINTTPVNCRSKRRTQFTISRTIPERVQHRWSHFPHPSSTERITSTQRPSLKEHLQNIGHTSAGVFDNRHYGTFPGKPGRVNSEITYHSHSSMNTSKPSSSRSFGSRGSFNSSEFSDKGTSILCHIEPVNEEPVNEDSLLEFSSQKCVSNSARSSGRSMGPISSRSSGRSSRQRSSTSPSFLRSHKNSKIERNKSPQTVCEEQPARRTVIPKGPYPLGITIAQGLTNGVFITGVNEESIASKVGLKYGDQLLEYNGINLRTASYEQAALILKQSALENTVTVLVQYNPHKMHENMSSTPVPEDDALEEPRLIRIEREPPSTPLGISTIGGNSIGVFISDIQKNGLVELQGGLRCGDQILQYNAKDLRRSTLEDATLELNKSTEVADFRVQYNPGGFKKAQGEIGDSFFVKAMFDRSHPPKGELSFHKGDILHVTETMYNKNQLGVWRASIVPDNPENDEYKKTRGKIPSRLKAEQEILLRRSSSYGEDKLKSRKSLFRRSKKGSSHHGINHSRESSDSKTSKDFEIASTISSGTSFALTQIVDDNVAYQRVKQLDSNFPRPVAIIGAMAEPVCDKLVVEYANKFARCLPEINESTKEMIEVNINDGTYIDYKLSPKGDRFQCITPQAIKDVIYGKSKHCLLDVNPEAVDKLAPLNLYPIIIYIKYKTVKQIKDIRDGRYIREKISTKAAKDLFELFAKVEKEFKHQFTAILTCNGLANICTEIVDCVKDQQRKALWVPDG